MLNPYITTFLKTAEEGSFSKAAEGLYLSKVSVMNQINALEAKIGAPLFARTNHGVTLTAAGKSFCKNAKKILRLSEAAIREARETAAAGLRTIRVGASLMRPCQPLMDYCEAARREAKDGKPPYRFSIVPFSDGPDGLRQMLAALGDSIDCFASPCGSTQILAEYGFLPFSVCKCEIAMSKSHRLANKKILRWEDLEQETLLLVKRGGSYVLDELRDDILRAHPAVHIMDFDGYYDMSAFNLCEERGFLMETLDLWESLHPSLVTVPVDWKYEIPYGVIYALDANAETRAFIGALS